MRLFHVFIVQLLILFGISLILLLLQQICTNLFLHLIEGGYRCVLLILNLNQMIAELCLYRANYLANLSRKYRLIELRNHLTLAEFAKVTALRIGGQEENSFAASSK